MDSFKVLQPRTRNEGKKKAHLIRGECGVPLGLEEILTVQKAEWAGEDTAQSDVNKGIREGSTDMIGH